MAQTAHVGHALSQHAEHSQHGCVDAAKGGQFLCMNTTSFVAQDAAKAELAAADAALADMQDGVGTGCACYCYIVCLPRDVSAQSKCKPCECDVCMQPLMCQVSYSSRQHVIDCNSISNHLHP